MLKLVRRGAALEIVARATGIPVAAIQVILRSSLAQGELARGS